MISMLRLINPPGSRPRRGFTIPTYAGGTRRRQQTDNEAEWFSSETTTPRRKRVTKPKRTVRSRSRTTVKRDKQGRFVRRTTTKRTVVSNPKTKKGVRGMTKKKTTTRRRVKRNAPKTTVVKRKTVRRVRKNPARVSSAAYRSGYARTFGTSTRKRKAAARKAAKTRAANKAKRVAAARKAARTRARRASKATTRKVVTHRTFTPRRRKGKVVGMMKARYAPQSKRRATHKVRRTVGRIKDRGGRKRVFYRYTVSRNPGTTMKNMLMDGAGLYGGFVGAKFLAGLLDQYVLKHPSVIQTTSKLGAFAGVLPSAASFFLAAFAGKAIKNPKVVTSLQTGATLAFLQSLVGAVLPATMRASLPPALSSALSGIDDMGFRGYGEYIQQRPQLGAYVTQAMAGNMGEYIQQNRQLGAYVEEAMALDEYIQTPGGMSGFEVEEALADSEVQGMQSGYAAGSLAKTAFSNF